MPIRVSTQNGVTVEFPDGTDEGTIRGVMTQAAGRPEEPKRNYGTGLLRQLEQGATFGFGDELNARVRSTAGDETYEKALEDERAANEAFSRENPWTATGAQIAGSIPTLFIPGVNAALGVKALQAAKTGWQAFSAGANVGARTGALSGFASGEGETEDEGTLNRLARGVVGGVIGAPLGAGLGYGGYRVGEAIGGVAAARAASEGPQAPYNAIARSLARDEVDPAALRSGMLPNATKSATQDQAAEVLRLTNTGATHADIASQTGLSGGVIRSIISRFDKANRTPLTIVDRAKLTGAGEGQNIEWTVRAAAATPGKARTQAARSLTERQLGQGARLNDAVQKYVATGTDDAIDQAQTALKAQEDAAYDAARASEQPFNLGPVLSKWWDKVNPNARVGLAEGRVSAGSGALRKKVASIVDEFTDVMDIPNAAGTGFVQGRFPIKGLARFQAAKRELDQVLEESFKDGRATQLTRIVQAFKKDVTKVVADANPAWKLANETFTGAGDRALKAGESLALRLNTKSRDVLNYFNRLTERAKSANPAVAAAGKSEIEMFRHGFSRAIQSRLANKGETHDLTRELMLPAARKILQTVLPKAQAKEFLRLLREEAVSTSSFRAVQGPQSPTTPLREAIEDLNAPAYLTRAFDYLNPRAIASELLSQGARRLYAPRNRLSMELLTDMDPIRQLQILQDISRYSAARGAAGSSAMRYAAPAIGAFTGNFGRR